MQSNPFSSVQKNRALPVGAILLSVFLGLSFLAAVGFAQVTDVSTSQSSYGAGDSVVISGSAGSGTLVALQVTNPLGTSIFLVTASASVDGSFLRTFKLPVDAMQGTYTVLVSEGGSTRTSTFTVGPPGSGVPAKPAQGVLSIVVAYDAAFNIHDIDGAMAFYADDAVVNIVPAPPGGVFSGKQQIQGWLQTLFADNVRTIASPRQVTGDKVSSPNVQVFVDSLKELGVYPIEGVAEVIVQGGKIRSLTFTWSPESLAKLQSALTIISMAEAFGEAAAAGDVDAIVDMFADDAVLTVEPLAVTPYKELYEPGKAGARDLYQTFFDDVTSFDVLSFELEENGWKTGFALFLKSFEKIDVVPVVGTTAFVVENGKIQSWTFTWSPESLALLALNAAENGQEMSMMEKKDTEMIAGAAGPAGQPGPAGAPGAAGPPGPAGGGDSALVWASLAIAIIAIAIAGVAIARGRKK